jgi:hypothetical protein
MLEMDSEDKEHVLNNEEEEAIKVNLEISATIATMDSTKTATKAKKGRSGNEGAADDEEMQEAEAIFMSNLVPIL